MNSPSFIINWGPGLHKRTHSVVWVKLVQWFWKRRLLINLVNAFSQLCYYLPLENDVNFHLIKIELMCVIVLVVLDGKISKFGHWQFHYYLPLEMIYTYIYTYAVTGISSETHLKTTFCVKFMKFFQMNFTFIVFHWNFSSEFHMQRFCLFAEYTIQGLVITRICMQFT